jgi:hypothetical protein
MAKSTWQSFDTNVRYFMAWADQVPAIATLFETISRAEPSLDPKQWLDSLGRRGDVPWPEREVGRAKLVLWILRETAAGRISARGYIMSFSHETNMNECLAAFCGEGVEPLIEYLQERLAAESDMLYLLERYRRLVLWFDAEALWGRYQADTQHGESIYDEHLRRFLFEQGVDFPYSQPAKSLRQG